MTGQVVIAGAGPVGVVCALGLAQAGVSVTLLEAEPAVVNSPRAVVYHWSLLKELDRLGLLKPAEEAGFRKQDYMFLVHETGERIAYSIETLAEYTDYPYNIHLGQHRFAEIAIEMLSAYPNVDIHWNSRVTGVAQDEDGVTTTALTPDGPREFRSEWLIGADGGRSGVRRSLGLSFDGFTWPERFVATNIIYDFDKYDYSRSSLVIDDNLGAVIAKIDNDGLWRYVFAEDDSLPEETIADRIPAQMANRLPGNEGYELKMFTPYRMHQRAAERFRVGRVLLAGDAAHVTNPVGAYGLCSGLFDAFALYEALGAVILDGADAKILDRYAELRRRTFVELVSPRASANKRTLFRDNDSNELEQDLTRLRKLTTDRDVLLKNVSFPIMLQSPSLLSPPGENWHSTFTV